MRRRRAAVALLVVPFLWLGLAAFWSSTAEAADDGKVSGYDVTWKSVDKKDWPKAGIPPIEQRKKDKYGRYSSYYACYDFGPYPNITQAVYNITNIILCGDVALALPQPIGVDSPNGEQWGCWDPPDAIRFTVPFTLPRCDFGYGKSFAATIDAATFQKNLNTSANLKVQEGVKTGVTPPFTEEERRAIIRQYVEDYYKGRADEINYQLAAENEQIARDTVETAANVTPGAGAIIGAAEAVSGEGVISKRQLNGTERTLAAVGALSALAVGAGAGTKGLLHVVADSKAASAARAEMVAVNAESRFADAARTGSQWSTNAAVTAQRTRAAANAASQESQMVQNIQQVAEGADAGLSIGGGEKTGIDYALGPEDGQ